MKKRESVRLGTKHQVAEFFSEITFPVLSFVQRLNSKQLRWLIDHKTCVSEAICGAISSLVKNIESLPDYLIWWQNFYSEEGIDVDFSKLEIPNKPEGDCWLILVAPMAYGDVIRALDKKFDVWVCKGDLDILIDFSKEQRRAAEKAYAVWVKAGVEADPDTRSEEELGDAPAITLMEGLLLEAFYFGFISDGRHLNVENIMRCSGSRYLDGGIPDILFNSPSNKVCVGRVGLDECCPRLRYRRSVY